MIPCSSLRGSHLFPEVLETEFRDTPQPAAGSFKWYGSHVHVGEKITQRDRDYSELLEFLNSGRLAGASVSPFRTRRRGWPEFVENLNACPNDSQNACNDGCPFSPCPQDSSMLARLGGYVVGKDVSSGLGDSFQNHRLFLHNECLYLGEYGGLIRCRDLFESAEDLTAMVRINSWSCVTKS